MNLEIAFSVRLTLDQFALAHRFIGMRSRLRKISELLQLRQLVNLSNLCSLFYTRMCGLKW